MYVKALNFNVTCFSLSHPPPLIDSKTRHLVLLLVIQDIELFASSLRECVKAR